MKGSRATVVSVAIAAISLALVIPALAIGIGVAPTSFELQDALGGAVYYASFLLMNPGEQAAVFFLKAEGEAGDWISFHPDRESPAAIDQVTVPAGGRSQISVRFAIPETAAVGVHKASIAVESVQRTGDGEGGSAQGSQGGASIVLWAHVEVTIQVIGSMILSGEVASITVSNAEAGLPIRVTVYFTNTGNLEARPVISLQVFKGGELAKSFSWDQVAVAPYRAEVIRVEAGAGELEMGEYPFKLTVSLGDTVVAAQEGLLAVSDTVTVRLGDTLTRIANRYGVSVAALAEANDIADPNTIYIGQVLKIPSTGEPSSTPGPTALPATVEPSPTQAVSSQATATVEAQPTATPEGGETQATAPPEAQPTTTPESMGAQGTTSPEAQALTTPESKEAQPTTQMTPIFTPEEVQAAMNALAQAAGCTPQVALMGTALCGFVVMRNRQKD